MLAARSASASPCGLVWRYPCSVFLFPCFSTVPWPRSASEARGRSSLSFVFPRSLPCSRCGSGSGLRAATLCYPGTSSRSPPIQILLQPLVLLLLCAPLSLCCCLSSFASPCVPRFCLLSWLMLMCTGVCFIADAFLQLSLLTSDLLLQSRASEASSSSFS
jgi:hypothetical protein